MTSKNIYQSSYFYRFLKNDFNPFTPNIIQINSNDIEYQRRNWHLISVDTQTYNFQNIVGIDVDKHLFGATIRIRTTGDAIINLHGFSKKIATEIRDVCRKQIALNTQRGTTEVLIDAIKASAGNQEGQPFSIADELMKTKKLLDMGAITQSEYDALKIKLLNQ